MILRLLIFASWIAVARSVTCQQCESNQGDCRDGQCSGQWCTASIVVNKAAGIGSQSTSIRKGCAAANPTGNKEDGCVKDPLPDGSESYRCGCSSDYCNDESSLTRMRNMLANRFEIAGGSNPAAGSGQSGSSSAGTGQFPGSGPSGQPGLVNQFPPNSASPNGTFTGTSSGGQQSPSGGQSPDQQSGAAFPAGDQSSSTGQQGANRGPGGLGAQSGNPQFPSSSSNFPAGGSNQQPSLQSGNSGFNTLGQGGAVPQGPSSGPTQFGGSGGGGGGGGGAGGAGGDLSPPTFDTSSTRPNANLPPDFAAGDSGRTLSTDSSFNPSSGGGISGGNPFPSTNDISSSQHPGSTTSRTPSTGAVSCACNEPHCSGSSCKGAMCYQIRIPANSLPSQALAGGQGDLIRTGCTDDANVLRDGRGARQQLHDYKVNVNGQDVVAPNAMAHYCRDKDYCNGVGSPSAAALLIAVALIIAAVFQRR